MRCAPTHRAASGSTTPSTSPTTSSRGRCPTRRTTSTAASRPGQQTRIDLEQKIPVHLVYFTAVVTPKGEIEFRRDFYGRDAKLWEALMDAGVALPGVQG